MVLAGNQIEKQVMNCLQVVSGLRKFKKPAKPYSAATQFAKEWYALLPYFFQFEIVDTDPAPMTLKQEKG
eukprot:7652043-Karenia_brevis.AAC.1